MEARAMAVTPSRESDRCSHTWDLFSSVSPIFNPLIEQVILSHITGKDDVSGRKTSMHVSYSQLFQTSYLQSAADSTLLSLKLVRYFPFFCHIYRSTVM
jgi:hypothetical protein